MKTEFVNLRSVCILLNIIMKWREIMNEQKVMKFASELSVVTLDNITIRGSEILLNKGHQHSINNQSGILSEINYFGKDLEFMVEGDGFRMPITIQLYENEADYYRMFVYNHKGMLTSVNLSTGYSDGEINLKIQVKLSNRNITKEEREQYREMMLSDIESEGIDILPKNTVYFGKYDTINERFIDTTPEKFLEQLIKVALIKGYYMKNKDYELSML